MLFSHSKPKIHTAPEERESFDGWQKCPNCHELIHTDQISSNFSCCPKCHHHYPLSAKKRIEMLADAESFQELFASIQPEDPLQFTDIESYPDRLARAQKKSGQSEALITGTAKLKGHTVALGAFDFSFIGGSMGSVVGERLTRLIEHALAQRIPLIVVSTSGGARMQESTLSLMQMAKTSAALAKLHKASIPYISVMTNPTSGGVTASFASLGDLIIAEPNALICFAGPRVIEQVIGQKLPKGAQKSEFLLQRGMIDCIVKRRGLKDKLARYLNFLNAPKRETQIPPSISVETSPQPLKTHQQERTYESTPS